MPVTFTIDFVALFALMFIGMTSAFAGSVVSLLFIPDSGIKRAAAIVAIMRYAVTWGLLSSLLTSLIAACFFPSMYSLPGAAMYTALACFCARVFGNAQMLKMMR